MKRKGRKGMGEGGDVENGKDEREQIENKGGY